MKKEKDIKRVEGATRAILMMSGKKNIDDKYVMEYAADIMEQMIKHVRENRLSIIIE